MKKVEITEASAPLAEYGRKAKKNPIIVLKNGKPVRACDSPKTPMQKRSRSVPIKILGHHRAVTVTAQEGGRPFVRRHSPPLKIEVNG
jgi:hypothetical protein